MRACRSTENHFVTRSPELRPKIQGGISAVGHGMRAQGAFARSKCKVPLLLVFSQVPTEGWKAVDVLFSCLLKKYVL